MKCIQFVIILKTYMIVYIILILQFIHVIIIHLQFHKELCLQNLFIENLFLKIPFTRICFTVFIEKYSADTINRNYDGAKYKKKQELFNKRVKIIHKDNKYFHDKHINNEYQYIKHKTYSNKTFAKKKI